MPALTPNRLRIAILAALLINSHVVAQDTATDEDDDKSVVLLETVTVTAQKREQQVKDVPISISAYSGDFLTSYGLTDMEDIGNLVPGLVVQEQSPNNPGFVIRGITSDSGESFVEPRVSVFQDGISISKSRGSIVQPFDLERIELLRGPQGTLFGRGAQVGAVHLIQNKPHQGTEGRFSMEAGEYDRVQLTGVVNGGLSSNLATRLAMFIETRDGYVDNLSGGDLNGKDTRALRWSWGLDIGDASRLDLILNYQKDTGPGTAFRSGSIPTSAGSLNVFDYTADLNRADELGLDRTVQGWTLLGVFPLSDIFTLSTITGWREFDSNEEFDADGSQIFALEFAEIAEGKQWSHEFRLNFDNGGAFRGFGGLSYFAEDGSQRVPFRTDERSFVTLPVLGTGIPPLLPNGQPNTLVTALPIAPGVVLPLKPFHEEEYANYGKTRALELFLDGTWSITDRFDLTLGLRGTEERVQSGYQASFFGVPSALGVLGFGGSASPMQLRNILFLPTARVNAEDEFSSAVGRAVGAYRFSDDINGYLSVSRGRRPDVIQFDPFAPGVAETLPAEIVWSYELGLKGNAFGDVLNFDAAIYSYDYDNFQTSVQNPNGPGFIDVNGGTASATGFELSTLWKFTDNVRGYFNYGYVDASFDETDDAGNPQALAGNRFRLTPENSLSAGLDVQFPVSARITGYVRPSASWRSQVYFEDNNTPGIEQDSYALFNLRAGVTLDNGRYDISVYGDNLGDEDYLIDAGNTGRLFGTPTFIVGAPSTYGIRITANF